jgi:shikimate dehydrogenase
MKLGLLGKDISYSLSPLIFHTISNFLQTPISYTLYDVIESDIKSVLNILRQGEIQGLNVTKPYKEKVIAYCDQLSEEAKYMGAVNVLVMKDNQLIGHNTDGFGFMSLVNHYQISLTDKRVCILGNGGSAKAVYQSLKSQVKDITVFKRAQSKQDVFAARERTYDQLDHKACDMYIQTTTLGLKEDDMSVIDQKDVINHTVIDLIYHRKTNIMTYSKHAYGGLMMLLYQAVKAYEIWTNEDISTRIDLISHIEEVLKIEFNRKSI